MKSVKNLTKEILYYCGFLEIYYRLKLSKQGRLLILMYHDIVNGKDEDRDRDVRGHRVTASQFEVHLAVLKKYCRVVSLREAIREIRGRGKLRQNSVAITFDDGYSSTYDIAYPLLKQHNVPATVYPITNWINKKMIPWWERLASVVRKGSIDESSIRYAEEILGVGLVHELEKIPDSFKQKKEFLKRVEATLRQKEDGQRRGLMDALESVIIREGKHEMDSCRPLSWEEIKQMATCGIEFGAHTCSHVNLSHVSDEVAEKEISQSKLEIERHLGEEVRGFAYPYGMDLSAYRSIGNILKKHGFEYACSAYPGVNTDVSDPYLLRRVSFPATASIPMLAWSLMRDLAADTKGLDSIHMNG